jgi:formamidopyrimidine-DNA glycosylase
MPELPDVEIARRDLRRWLVRATVTAAGCTDAHVSRPTPASLFARTLVGKAVEAREDARAITSGIRRAIARELRELGGRKTRHRHSFFVYGRAGEPCPRCHTLLTRTTVGGRTSVFCRRCQVRRTQR